MAGEPQLAASDLAIKLDFQKKQLDRKLVDLGYGRFGMMPRTAHPKSRIPNPDFLMYLFTLRPQRPS